MLKHLIASALIASAPQGHAVTGSPNNIDNAFDVVGITATHSHWAVNFSYTCPDKLPASYPGGDPSQAWFRHEVHLTLHREGPGRHPLRDTDMYDQRDGSLRIGRPHAGSFSLRVQTGCDWAVVSDSGVTVKKLG
jgi:hypothetical protein